MPSCPNDNGLAPVSFPSIRTSPVMFSCGVNMPVSEMVVVELTREMLRSRKIVLISNTVIILLFFFMLTWLCHGFLVFVFLVVSTQLTLPSLLFSVFQIESCKKHNGLIRSPYAPSRLHQFGKDLFCS